MANATNSTEQRRVVRQLMRASLLERQNFLGFVIPFHCMDMHRLLNAPPICLGVVDMTMGGHGMRVGPEGSRGCRSVKISREQFLDEDLLDRLSELDPDMVFVDMADIGVGFGSSLAALIDKFSILAAQHEKRGVRIIPIIGGHSPLEELARQGLAEFPVALKGSEASGFCGTDTVSLLFDAAVCRHGWSPSDIVIWGGVAIAEAAAIFFALGVRGIVHESLHWLTSAVDLSPAMRRMISSLSPEHTTIVGEAVGLPVRLYDKGNSKAVRYIREKEDRLLNAEPGEARRNFLAEVTSMWRHPLMGDPGLKELAPLSAEAAFAHHFVERYGEGFDEAVSKYGAEITRLCGKAPRALDELRSGRAAKALGTAYPILQGGMSWITDNIELASAVADAGGLPTLAVGLKSRSELDLDFAGLSEAMGSRPYALNIIALDENPRLQEQIDWIAELRPPFVVVAAGSPSYVRRFRALGTKVIYIAHSEDLIRLAAKEGASFIVIEGSEAGGHVGTLTSLTLAQVALALRRAQPELFDGAHLVLAGGIHDRVSALRAAMLGAEAFQMGTAYLASREIVETGALAEAYQESVLDARPGDTRVTGRRIGLRVRALKSPKLESIEQLEREMAFAGLDEQEARHRMEALCAGSLLVAAKETKEPGGGRLAAEVCLREGQYMCGAVAGNIDRRYSLQELHAELFAPVSPLYVPVFTETKGPAPSVITSPKGGRERIAVTGMALNNALGTSVAEIWANTKALKCGVTEVPASRWDHGAYFDAEPGKAGKTYCRVAALQNLAVTRKEIGVPPQDFNTMCQSTRMTLWLARNAIESSGILDSTVPRERIGVIVSQNSGEMGSTVADLVLVMGAGDIVETIRHAAPMSDSAVRAAVASLRKGRVMVDDTTLLGRINSAAGGFICNRHGLRGPAFSVGAACATGLVALWCAYGMVRAGILDAAVVGGSEELLMPATFLEFSALRALAGAFHSDRPQACRPFDAHRDGMVLGEGGAVLIIERESVARKRGARIHAFLEGMGAGNNDLGMVESAAETQQIAIRNAYTDAGWDPCSVGLIECHATATVQGDVEEVKALKAVIPRGSGITLSSFKSQVGHTLGASGLMSLIRGVCAMSESVFPPTLNYETPDPAIGIEEWGFRVPGVVEEWPRPQNGRRRLEVNSFGFGGSNYVALLEEAGGNGGARIAGKRVVSPDVTGVSPSSLPLTPHTVGLGTNHVPKWIPPSDNVGPWESQDDSHPGEIPSTRTLSKERDAVASTGTGADLGDAEHKECSAWFFAVGEGSGSLRVAVTAASEAEAQDRLDGLDIERGQSELSPARLRTLARRSIFVESTKKQSGRLGLVFAGQGTVYPGMGASLYRTIPSFRRRMDRLAPLLGDLPILDLLFRGDEDALKNTRLQQPGLFIFEYALAGELLDLGITPACLAGHSMGELTALSFAGVFSPEDGLRIVDKRAQCMADAASLVDDPGVMLAVDAGADTLEPMLRDYPSIFITNLNSPAQTVIGGTTRQALALAEKLRSKGRRATQLNVSMVFHSPRMRVIRDELQAFVDEIPFRPPNIPVISNTTGRPFADDPKDIKRIVMDHLERPVLWIDNIRFMHRELGVGTFLEVGPSDVLCSMVQAILPDAICIPSCLREGPGHALAAASAELYRLNLFNPPRVLRLWQSNPPGDSSADSPVRPSAALPAGSTADSHTGSPHGCPATSPPSGRGHEYVTGSTDIRPDHEGTTSRSPRPAETDCGISPSHASSFDRKAALNVVQREATRFALEGIERYLKPAVLEALRREISPEIGLHDVASLMHSLRADRQAMPASPAETVSPRPASEGISSSTSPPSSPIASASPPSPHHSSLITHHSSFPLHDSSLPIDDDPVVEAVIQIIMEATGYEREEIAPEMDIRKDLTIRSSRLPVIMDAAERRFGISIQVMDFMTVRAVRDIADVIKELVGRQGSHRTEVQPEPRPRPGLGTQHRIAQEVPLPSHSKRQKAPILRHVFVEAPLEEICSEALRGMDGKTVVVAVSNPSGAFLLPLERLLSGAGARVQTVSQTMPEAVLAAVHSAGDDLAGLVIVAEGTDEVAAEAATYLTDWFKVVQALVAVHGAAFVLYVQDRRGIMFEGMLGMFLSASQEKKGTLFRCLEIRPGASPDKALAAALGRQDGIVELIATPSGLFTTGVQPSPGRIELSRGRSPLPKGGAVILSGGARGITAWVARGLAAVGYPLVLCGTTPLDRSIDYEATFRKPLSAEEALAIHLAAHRLDPDPEAVRRLRAGMEIYSTLADVKARGVEAIYRVCDVADSSQVQSLMHEAVARFGAVEGVVHGAGVLRDSFISLASPEDFALVCRVKCAGASHLFEAARTRGLEFFAAFSSLAAYQGNIGQAAYCAANRAMAALMLDFSRQAPKVKFKTFWLPPVEGAGMADDPEVREILNLRSLDKAYMDLGEMFRFFDLEMFFNGARDAWVMPARFVPKTPAVVEAQPAAGTCIQPPAGNGAPSVAGTRPSSAADASVRPRMLLGHGLKPGDFPMVDEITSYDPEGGRIFTMRGLSSRCDSWLEDHRPFRFIDAPLVSAIVGTENMLETAALLWPGLKPVHITSLSFLDTIAVPEGSTVETRCLGEKRSSAGEPSAIVATAIEAQGDGGEWTPRFSGVVHLARELRDIPELPGFPVRREELEIRPLTEREVIDLYEKKTCLTGRYRVLRSVDGSSRDAIRATMFYRESDDFASRGRACYVYSPYVLEGFLHLVSFFSTMRDEIEQRALVPAHIESVHLGRFARDGEPIILEGRLVSQTESGLLFDCRASDGQGKPLMLARGVNLRWISG
jgi:acyl transferase domain-containing protein/NAD(P)H-dependent flavin oxidoreductase YrpB (nitropropane dioxygenase family)/NAD(P)-dependent dehydrogenase (short-subunit alcohol dehydrogenase family)/acyl carrier protein